MADGAAERIGGAQPLFSPPPSPSPLSVPTLTAVLRLTPQTLVSLSPRRGSSFACPPLVAVFDLPGKQMKQKEARNCSEASHRKKDEGDKRRLRRGGRMSPVTADGSFYRGDVYRRCCAVCPSIHHPSVRPSIILSLLCHPSICQLDEWSFASSLLAKSSFLANVSERVKNIYCW